MSVAFLGGGNMARALVGGLLARGFEAASIAVAEKDAAQRERLARAHPVRVCAQAVQALAGADTLIVAVKPQDLRAALAPLAGRLAGVLVVSIAAGARVADLGRWLGGHRRIVRAMPNTPALVGAGVTALWAPLEVDEAGRARAEQVLGAIGRVLWVEREALMDAVTAISGSGPAYVFWLIEQLAAAGERMGLAKQTAAVLALETVAGAARLAVASGESPAVLRAGVTSKGGTTEAALRVFEEERLAERFARALEAARSRGVELGEALGRE